MAKKLAIPDDRREWPDWEYRPFPKWLGRDELGNDLIAGSEADVETLTPQIAFPMPLGHDARGNLITAMHPDDYQSKKNQVTRPLEEATKPEAETEVTTEKPTRKSRAA